MPTGNFSDYGGPLREEAREALSEAQAHDSMLRS